MALTEEDKEQLFGEIENEGFGYWVQNYGFDEKDKDPKLVELCEKASDAMNELQSYLREQDIEV